MNPVTRWFVTGALLVLVGACGSAPKEEFYTLAAGSKLEAGSLPAQDYAVTIGPVYVPDAVDRPQFVLRTPGNQVRIAEQVRWAEPLRDGIARAVAVDLAHSLNNGRVSPRAQPALGEADYRVAVDVQRFDSALAEGSTMEVMWTVRRMKDGDQRSGRVRVREAAAAATYEELVNAHMRALSTVSMSIAEAIRSFRERDLAATRTGSMQ